MKKWWDLGRVCSGLVLVVKELGFLNVRSVVALTMAQTVPSNEDHHPLPKPNRKSIPFRVFLLRLRSLL